MDSHCIALKPRTIGGISSLKWQCIINFDLFIVVVVVLFFFFFLLSSSSLLMLLLPLMVLVY